MIGVIRSELLRVRRRNLLLGWFGLIVMFAALINFVMFQVVDQTGTAPDLVKAGGTTPDPPFGNYPNPVPACAT